MKYSELEKCNIVYQLTSLPDIIFSGITKGNNVFHFEKGDLEIPFSIRGKTMELRVAIYSEEGECLDFSSTMCFIHTAVPLINSIPLKMILSLLD